jgi:hypothetical protein
MVVLTGGRSSDRDGYAKNQEHALWAHMTKGVTVRPLSQSSAKGAAIGLPTEGVTLTVSLGGRARTALISLATLALAVAPAAPALAATSGPPTPVDLFQNFQTCSADATSPVYVDARQSLPLEALSEDSTDSPFVTEQFRVWPVSDPSQVVTFSNQFALPGIEETVSVPGSDLTDGLTYAWTVQTIAASGTSAGSAPCYFTVDDTSPTSAPTVTSSNYPSGQRNQGGAPIQLTLGANGVNDVAGYVFSWVGTLPVAGIAEIGPHGIPQPIDPYTSDPSNFAAASTLGGSATVSLVPPTDTGFLVLTVASLDRAFNESPATTFFIFVKPDAPTITQLNPNVQFDKRAEFRLTPDPGLEAASPVTSYTVQFFGQTGKTFTVKAAADGTAVVGLTLDSPNADFLTVTSTSADGWVSQNQFWNFQVDTTPTVGSDVYLENQTSGGVGVPGTFTFAPKVKGITTYTYGFSDGTAGTVATHSNGTARITFTPTQSGFYFLDVYGTTQDGLQLADYFYVFFVN